MASSLSSMTAHREMTAPLWQCSYPIIGQLDRGATMFTVNAKVIDCVLQRSQYINGHCGPPTYWTNKLLLPLWKLKSVLQCTENRAVVIAAVGKCAVNNYIQEAPLPRHIWTLEEKLPCRIISFKHSGQTKGQHQLTDGHFLIELIYFSGSMRPTLQ